MLINQKFRITRIKDVERSEVQMTTMSLSLQEVESEKVNTLLTRRETWKEQGKIKDQLYDRSKELMCSTIH